MQAQSRQVFRLSRPQDLTQASAPAAASRAVAFPQCRSYSLRRRLRRTSAGGTSTGLTLCLAIILGAGCTTTVQLSTKDRDSLGRVGLIVTEVVRAYPDPRWYDARVVGTVVDLVTIRLPLSEVRKMNAQAAACVAETLRIDYAESNSTVRRITRRMAELSSESGKVHIEDLGTNASTLWFGRDSQHKEPLAIVRSISESKGCNAVLEITVIHFAGVMGPPSWSGVKARTCLLSQIFSESSGNKPVYSRSFTTETTQLGNELIENPVRACPRFQKEYVERLDRCLEEATLQIYKDIADRRNAPGSATK